MSSKSKVFYILSIRFEESGKELRRTCTGDIFVSDIHNHRKTYKEVKTSVDRMLKKDNTFVIWGKVTVLFYSVKQYEYDWYKKD